MDKVCFFITSLNSGGIENYLLRFLKKYHKQIDATVFCKGDALGELEKQYRTLSNVRIVKNKISYLPVTSQIKLYRYLKEEKFDAVCDFTGNFAGLVLKQAKKCGVKNRLAFYRGSTNHFKENRIKNWYNNFLNRMVSKYATTVLSNSKAALDFFFKNIDERFSVVYNGVDINEFNIEENKSDIRKSLGIPENAFVIGHTGRLHYSKNHQTILKVAHLICEKYPQIHFVLCGKNTETLTPEINQKIKDQIHLLGYRKDIPRILKSFDLYFFPSITEGQPNALIEAMLADLPIVASNISPIQEMLPNAMIASLHAPDDVVGFVKEIEDIYLKNKEQPELQNWALENFNSDTQFEKFYKKLIR